MTTEFKQKILTHGLFLGLAISSRFLLNFQDGVWAEVLSFVLLFAMYSALIMWLREYQKNLPESKITLKQILSFSFQVFLIGAVVSSIFKFIYFQHIKPSIFATIVSQYDQIHTEYVQKVQGMIVQAQKENKTDDILMLKQGIEQLNWWKSIVISSYFQPLFSMIVNVLGGLLLGWFIWPLFKFNQQKSTPINQ